MASGSRRFLWIAWSLSFGVGLTCAAIFIHGIIRDMRPFDAGIRLDLASTSSGWMSAPFRVWGEETYHLLLRSANHDPALVGHPLMAEFDVRVLTPDGEPVFEQSYGVDQTGHVIPDNYGDARLATLQLSDWPLRPWALQVRVTEPDPAFASVFSDLDLYEQRDIQGMEGLVSYAMVVPGALLMVLALVASTSLAWHGTLLPLVVTITAIAAMLILSG